MQDGKKPVHLHGELYLVPLSLLKPANRVLVPSKNELRFSNPRKFMIGDASAATGMDSDDMDDLGESIIENGLMHPLFVRPMEDHFEIVDGERRWRRIKKAFGEQKMCRGVDGTMVPAHERYEMVECRVRKMTDLEAYKCACGSPGVPPSPGAVASLVKYLHDCEVKEDEILRVVNKRSHKWLIETLTIMALDKFCVEQFLKGTVSRNKALAYAKILDVPARVEMCKADIAKVEGDHVEMVKAVNHRLNEAIGMLDKATAKQLLARHSGEETEQTVKEVETAQKDVARRQQEKEEAEETPVQVNLRNTSIGGDKPKFIKRTTMEREWILPLEEIVHAKGMDKAGKDLGVDVEDAKFVLWLWKLMCRSETDLVGELRKRARKRANV